MQRLLCGLLLVVLGSFAVLPFVFIGAGTWMLGAQHYRIASYLPVQATVLSKQTVRAGASTTRSGKRAVKPVIEYRYEVEGQVYTCDQVTAVSEGRSGRWATEILKRYEIGKTYQAYYNPDHPEKAFLLADYSFLGGYFVLFPMMMVLTVSRV